MRWTKLVGAVAVALSVAACAPHGVKTAPAPAAEAGGDKGKELKMGGYISGEEDARRMLEEPQWGDVQRFKDYCAASITRAKMVRERLRKGGQAGAQVVSDFDQLSRELETAGNLAGLMFTVHPDKAYRDAAQQCERDVEQFGTETSLDHGLYEALAGVKLDGVDPMTKRFVEHGLRDFRRAGVDKDDATRARITAINKRLVELEQAYIKNISEDTRHIEVTDAAKLKGLPQDWLDKHKPNAEGKIVVTTDYPDFYPFETYVADQGLRRDLYVAFQSRAFPVNVGVLKEVLALRSEKAKLLGFQDWAHYATADKMVKSAETVDAFIKNIAKIIRPRSEADLKTLLARKRKDHPKATQIESFDRFYYMALVQKEQFGFDAQAVRPYFSYPAVKDGVLGVYAKLLGVTFNKVQGAKVWHPSVEEYEVREGDKLIGRFYLDMFPRADKYKHAATFPIQTGAMAVDGVRRVPYGALVCNFPNPAEGDHKALMEHNDVVTFFHEFGHLVHHLMGQRSRYIDLNGFHVEWDFVEVPSQLLEEWAWSPEVLQGFAKHVDTGAPIPADLVKKMKAADEFGKGVSLMRQVFYTAVSFYLHEADPATLDLRAYADELFAKYSPFPPLKGGAVYANFGHLMGYSALYYTYQWSLSIAKDLFTRFHKEGLMNPATDKAYRQAVLEAGGTQDADELVKRFLGRPRNLDAYKAWIQQKQQ